MRGALGWMMAAVLVGGGMARAGGKVVVVTEAGVVGDGKTMNTEAIAKAIGDVAAEGGGKVVFPAGTYLTGPMELKSGVEVHVERGGTVLFSRDVDDYAVVMSDYEGHATPMRRSPIWAKDAHDISITGEGTFDGQGDAWRPLKREKVSDERWAEITKTGVINQRGDLWYPSQAVLDGQTERMRRGPARGPMTMEEAEKVKQLLRPPLMLIEGCKKVRLEGVTFRNSASWDLHLLLCDGLRINGVTIFNEAYAQNGDGMDLDSCRDVVVEQCDVNAGDDGICIKSGRDEEGRKRGRATENVIIRNCTVGWAHGGVVIGSEMSGGVRNIDVSNCIFKGTEVGLRFKTTRGRGGVVENVSIQNIEMTDIHREAILFDMYYMTRDPRPEPVTERTPAFRDFSIRNVRCDGAASALMIRGLPELPIKGITLENVKIKADRGGAVIDGEDIVLKDVEIRTKEGEPLVVRNVKNLITERLTAVVESAGGATTRPTSQRGLRAATTTEGAN